MINRFFHSTRPFFGLLKNFNEFQPLKLMQCWEKGQRKLCMKQKTQKIILEPTNCSSLYESSSIIFRSLYEHYTHVLRQSVVAQKKTQNKLKQKLSNTALIRFKSDAQMRAEIIYKQIKWDETVQPFLFLLFRLSCYAFHA